MFLLTHIKPVLLLLVAFFVVRAHALSCPPCEPAKCAVPMCHNGVLPDVCNCCETCAKGESEQCGGPWNIYGKCGVGLRCIPQRRHHHHHRHRGRDVEEALVHDYATYAEYMNIVRHAKRLASGNRQNVEDTNAVQRARSNFERVDDQAELAKEARVKAKLRVGDEVGALNIVRKYNQLKNKGNSHLNQRDVPSLYDKPAVKSFKEQVDQESAVRLAQFKSHSEQKNQKEQEHAAAEQDAQRDESDKSDKSARRHKRHANKAVRNKVQANQKAVHLHDGLKAEHETMHDQQADYKLGDRNQHVRDADDVAADEDLRNIHASEKHSKREEHKEDKPNNAGKNVVPAVKEQPVKQEAASDKTGNKMTNEDSMANNEQSSAKKTNNAKSGKGGDDVFGMGAFANAFRQLAESFHSVHDREARNKRWDNNNNDAHDNNNNQDYMRKIITAGLDEQGAMDKAKQGNGGREKTVFGNAAIGHVAHDNAVQENAANGMAVQNEAAKNKEVIENAAQDKAAQETAARDKAAQETAAKDRAAQETAARDKAAQETAARNKAAQETAARDKAAQETAARDKAAQETAARDKDAQEKAARGKEANAKDAKHKAAHHKYHQSSKLKAALHRAAMHKAAKDKAAKERHGAKGAESHTHIEHFKRNADINYDSMGEADEDEDVMEMMGKGKKVNDKAIQSKGSQIHANNKQFHQKRDANNMANQDGEAGDANAAGNLGNQNQHQHRRDANQQKPIIAGAQNHKMHAEYSKPELEEHRAAVKKFRMKMRGEAAPGTELNKREAKMKNAASQNGGGDNMANEQKVVDRSEQIEQAHHFRDMLHAAKVSEIGGHKRSVEMVKRFGRRGKCQREPEPRFGRDDHAEGNAYAFNGVNRRDEAN